MRPLIFSGTTEGRQMSERLSEAGIEHIVCVATGYGELVMKKTAHADIRQGRLTADEMETMIAAEADIVFDATHPYASEVSKNIRSACEKAERSYVRILRSETPAEGCGVREFADAASCAEALRETSGNILLTTGSKELAIYAADPEVRRRLFARVLPSEESLHLCSEAGISGRQVIAMQGPFSMEMDLAVIRQYDIRTMVTKASGKKGGFDEKAAAAAEAGIQLFVIGRPSEESGISADEALKEYFGLNRSMHIDLIGIGPGDPSLMTRGTIDALDKAEIIFGAERMIKPYCSRETYPFYKAKDIIPVLDTRRPGSAAVLFSGDTGFFSGAAKMRPALEEWLAAEDISHEIVIHPGISAFSYLSAKTGIDYSDAVLCSMHGRSKDRGNLMEIADMIMAGQKVFVILSGTDDVNMLASELMKRGLADCKVILGRELSYSEETIEELSLEDCLHLTGKGLYTAVVCRSDKAPARSLVPVLSDDSFIRGKVPMTKENIRHLSVMKLGLTKDSVVYDIGSGTGSVACEMALQSSSLRVFAIEMKEDACELITKNAEKFGLTNIQVVSGKAPDAFDGLEIPTHVFIGGSSGNLRDILKKLSSSAKGIRVVINAVSLETMAEIQRVLSEFEITDLSIEQISVSRSRELGSYHLLTAENPVMIASFILGGAL